MATVTGSGTFAIAALALTATGDASASSTHRLACVVGGVALTGQAATMWYQSATSSAGGQITIDVTAVATGSCSLVVTCGNATASAPLTVSSGYTLGADAQPYTLTGVAATPAMHRLMAAGAGAFTETGVAAGSTRTYKYTVGPAQTFALGASSTALVKIGGYVMPTTTSATVLGTPTQTLRAVRATAGATGAYTLTGVATPMGAQYHVDAATSALTRTSPAVTLTRSARLIAATADAYVVFTSPAGGTFTRRLTSEPGALALTGQEVTLTEGVSGSTVMPAVTCEYEANGVAASFRYSGALTSAVVRRRRVVAGGIR